MKKIIRNEDGKINLKKPLWFTMMFAGPLALIILLIYLYTAGRFDDLIKWQLLILIAIVLVSIVAMSPLVFSLLDLYIARKSTKRKHVPSRVFWAFGVIGLVAPVGVMGVLVGVSISSGDKAPQLLILSGTGDNGIPDLAVVFWTEKPSTFQLKWGKTLSMTDPVLSQEETGNSNQHVFLLENLDPGTTYFYQITGFSPVYNFTTVSTSTPDTLSFALSSDCHFGAGTNNLTATTNILKAVSDPANGYDMFFVTGDLVEYGFMDSQWSEFLNTTSPYTTHIPFRPLIGNHDGFAGGINTYRNYLHPESMPSTNGSEYYYHSVVNGIHIFCLDLEWGTETYSAEQKAWFEAELDGIDNEDWVIVMSHCFFYASGGLYGGKQWWDHPDMISEFNKTFVDHDVDMVFSGHNHNLEVLNSSGVMYNVVGGFGGILDPPAEEHGGQNSTYSEWYLPGQFGYADVNISGDFARVRYRNPENGIIKEFIHYK